MTTFRVTIEIERSTPPTRVECNELARLVQRKCYQWPWKSKVVKVAFTRKLIPESKSDSIKRDRAKQKTFDSGIKTKKFFPRNTLVNVEDET